MHAYTLIALLSAPLLALAKTDIGGCTTTVSGASVIYYVPGTGEICEFLDCGGGRAPPKTTVPGCPLYSGTATYSPNYLPGFGLNAVATSSAAAVVSSVSSAVVITSQPTVSTSSASSRGASSSASASTPSTSSRSSASTSSVRSSSSQASITSTSRISNSTVASPTATAFGGVAGHIRAEIGLVGFMGAVVALL